MINITQLKKQFYSSDYDLALEASDELAKIGNKEVVKFLAEQLESDNGSYRNLSALALREIKDSSVVDALIKNIFKPGNERNRGTMVYALEELDCSSELVNIFKIFMYGNYECKSHASSILNNQEFEFYKEDLKIISDLWADCKVNPEKCPCYEDAKDHIQSDIDAFWDILNEQQ